MADFDLFVIGAGSGGVRAARIAAENGAKVAIAEEFRVGGTCVVRGCIPKKFLVYASHFAEDFEDAASYGWKIDGVKFDWKTLIAAKDKEIDRLENLYFDVLDRAGIKLYQGHATLKDKNTVQIGKETATAETILVATGGHPFLPDHPGIEHAITSNEVFHLKNLPKTIMIAGAGYIAVEFACIFNGLGVDTTVVYRRDKVLRGFDEDLRDHLTAAMKARGIRFIFDTIVERIDKTDNGVRVTCTNGSISEVQEMMFAVGRLANTKGIGLEEIGVELKPNGAVVVDKFSKSSVDNIYAVGDVTDHKNLTPVAIKEGHAFALTVYGGQKISPEHDNIPAAVFSQPQIGTVGLSETQAKEKYGEIDVYTSHFRVLKHTLTPREEKTFVKMIVDKKSQVVVGAHMLGMDAAEIIQGIGIAVKNKLKKADFDRTLAIHPTTAEEFVLLKK
ncbi:MAG: glutathione-disulfide reductase [Alphaproteobacteria bacterium]